MHVVSGCNQVEAKLEKMEERCESFLMVPCQGLLWGVHCDGFIQQLLVV